MTTVNVRKTINCSGADVFKFMTLTDYIDFVDLEGLIRHNKHKREIEKHIFWGRDDISEKTFKDDIHKIWKEGVETVERMKQELKDRIPPIKLKSRKRKLIRDEEEGEYDPEAHFQGDPCFTQSVREESTGSNNVTVVIGTQAPWNISAIDVFYRAAVGLSLVDILYERGYNVEVWSSLYSRNIDMTRKTTHICCLLKGMDEALDVQGLSNALSGWFFRVGAFAAIIAIARYRNSRHNSNMGRPMIPTRKELKSVSVDENMIFIDGFYDLIGAVSCLSHELHKFKSDA